MEMLERLERARDEKRQTAEYKKRIERFSIRKVSGVVVAANTAHSRSTARGNLDLVARGVGP